MQMNLVQDEAVLATRTQQERAQLLQATEKVKRALLDSVAQDLRTPLVSIQGTLSWLQDDTTHLDDTTRLSLIANAAEEAKRLNVFIGNLLDMARIESGTLQVDPTPCDVEDVIGSALERMNGYLGDHAVKVVVPQGLGPVLMDFALMVKALVHLLDNAIKYSPPATPIDITAADLDAQRIITVADRGHGIPPQDLTRVFERFYRVPRADAVIGTGLGLSICQGIVAAHGGRIQAENRDGGGTLVTLMLPL